MRAAWLSSPGKIGVKELPKPVIKDSLEAIVNVKYAGICGSDLWPYRGIVGKPGGSSTGHEFIGVVEEIGAEVTGFKPGALVIAPFMFSDGTCEMCLKGLQPLCSKGGLWGRDWAGAQAEQIRVPFADATLVALPWQADELDSALARRLLPAADVFATGTHGAVLAEIKAGELVAVIGDGAVGISAAIASKQRGAAKVIVLGENYERLKIAESFGVETLCVSRDESPFESLKEMTSGILPHKVIECVGLEGSFNTALEIVTAGGRISFVGVPHGVPDLSLHRIFSKQVILVGGVAPARSYLPQIIAQISVGDLDLGSLIDAEFALTDVADAFLAMHEGRVLKAMLDVSR